MLPPLGSQYLNLAKNTSLGIAVAYADIVQVGQTHLQPGGQTLAVFLIWMVLLLVREPVAFGHRQLLQPQDATGGAIDD